MKKRSQSAPEVEAFSEVESIKAAQEALAAMELPEVKAYSSEEVIACSLDDPENCEACGS